MKKQIILLATSLTILAADYNLPIRWEPAPHTNAVTYTVYLNGAAKQQVTGTNTIVSNMPVNITNVIYVTARAEGSAESAPSNGLTNLFSLTLPPFNLQINGPVTLNLP